MQPNIDEIFLKTLEEECPTVLDAINAQGDWHLADARELSMQIRMALHQCYLLGRSDERELWTQELADKWKCEYDERN